MTPFHWLLSSWSFLRILRCLAQMGSNGALFTFCSMLAVSCIKLFISLHLSFYILSFSIFQRTSLFMATFFIRQASSSFSISLKRSVKFLLCCLIISSQARDILSVKLFMASTKHFFMFLYEPLTAVASTVTWRKLPGWMAWQAFSQRDARWEQLGWFWKATILWKHSLDLYYLIYQILYINHSTLYINLLSCHVPIYILLLYLLIPLPSFFPLTNLPSKLLPLYTVILPSP